MNTYKAIAILAAFSTQELRLLDDYLSLKSSNCRPQLIAMFRLLVKHKKAFPASKNKLSEVTGLSIKRLDDLMNKILKPLEKFCAIQSIQESTSELERQYHLLEFYSKRKLYDQFIAVDKQIAKSLLAISTPWPSERLVFYKYFKLKAVHEKIVFTRKQTIALSEYTFHLDIFYCTEKLKLACELINRSKLSSIYIDSSDILLAEELSKKYSSTNPLLGIYLNTKELLENPSLVTTARFANLYKQVIDIKITKQSYEEVITLLHYLINITLRAFKLGDETLKAAFLSIMEFMDSKNLLLERGVIAAPIFKAAISMGLKCKRLDWTESFLKKYANHLSGHNKSEVIKFCNAQIAFYCKDYDKTRVFLDSIHQPTLDIYFLLNIRKLYIKIFVEANFRANKYLPKKRDADRFEHIMRNFRIFVNKKDNLTKSKIRINDEQKRAILKFILYLKKLVLNYQKMGIPEILRGKIQNDRHVVEREWLLSLLK